MVVYFMHSCRPSLGHCIRVTCLSALFYEVLAVYIQYLNHLSVHTYISEIFYSNYMYDQASRIIWWKKKVHDNGLTLFCNDHMAVFLLDISTLLC